MDQTTSRRFVWLRLLERNQSSFFFVAMGPQYTWRSCRNDSLNSLGSSQLILFNYQEGMKTIWKEMMIRISATRRESLVRRMVVMVGLFGFIAFPVHAQTFSSGSTGEDGALDLSSCPQICEVQLPESGVLNYTTVNIPSGKTLRFKVNSRNTPVIMLAQGTVTISGAIDVSASGDPITGRSKPGPG